MHRTSTSRLSAPRFPHCSHKLCLTLDPTYCYAVPHAAAVMTSCRTLCRGLPETTTPAPPVATALESTSDEGLRLAEDTLLYVLRLFIVSAFGVVYATRSCSQRGEGCWMPPNGRFQRPVVLLLQLSDLSPSHGRRACVISRLCLVGHTYLSQPIERVEWTTSQPGAGRSPKVRKKKNKKTPRRTWEVWV